MQMDCKLEKMIHDSQFVIWLLLGFAFSLTGSLQTYCYILISQIFLDTGIIYESGKM